MPAEIKVQLAVLGAGPGGYAAAFRAADLGLKVALIERHAALGGVCLNVGCIPSKALLHVAGVINEAAHAKEIGLGFGAPKIDLAQIRKWKDGVVGQLTAGLAGLAKKRKVEVVRGEAKFSSANAFQVEHDGAAVSVQFEQAVIAAGSAPAQLRGAPQDARVMDSTGALALADVPKHLLVVGGGIIGLEMATVYHALGSRISVVEMQDGLMAGADPDLLRPLAKKLGAQYENIWLGAGVREMKAAKNGVQVSFDGKDAPKSAIFDKALVSVGRSPNGARIGADAAGVAVDERGFIKADETQRTNVPHIFAIGDIVGEPMLAHKAAHQGKVAAEAAAGMKSAFTARVIPSVAYTDPEVAWAGLTETEAKARGVAYGKGVVPWMASGRALSQASPEGVTKLLFDPETERLLGAGITGRHAGDLIAEAALAIEMNADAEDIGLTIHPHPTLAETLGLAAEVFGGVATDLYAPRRKAKTG
ncbi:MAG: dihydrolipoyl dehydrogenase [Gammaproteobacteria bacterium]|nr:dihydrolipoyl dehydrogenase [Gammaproteobacteria bacterium]